MDPKRKKILEKADIDLHRTYLFFQKAADHRLTMAETIRSATIKLERIEQALGPARGSRAADRLKLLKRQLARHVVIQKRAMDVFEAERAVDSYLNTWIPDLYCTRREWLLKPGGVEAVLNELGQIEHGVIR